METKWRTVGALWAALAVALGAFGAHALRERVSPADLEIWRTGAQYNLIHAVAVTALAGRTRWVAGLFAGSAIFAGTLYLLVLTGARWWGAVTPLGGATLIASWIGVALDRRSFSDRP